MISTGPLRSRAQRLFFYQVCNCRVRGGITPRMDDDKNTTVTDAAVQEFNTSLFKGCPAGSVELASELTERSLGYPLNVMSLLYYECGDSVKMEDPHAPDVPRS